MNVQEASSAAAQASRAARTLLELFLSGRPLTYVRTAEEERVARILAELAPELPVPGRDTTIPVWTWSLTEGLRRPGGSTPQPGSESATGVLAFIAAASEPGLYHLKDFHEAMRESALVRRHLRDLYASCSDRHKFVVITSPVRDVPAGTRAHGHRLCGSPDARHRGTHRVRARRHKDWLSRHPMR
ncbi:MAG: hypothetical protein QM757_30650 [Paludibaculum sp.]